MRVMESGTLDWALLAMAPPTSAWCCAGGSALGWDVALGPGHKRLVLLCLWQGLWEQSQKSTSRIHTVMS